MKINDSKSLKEVREGAAVAKNYRPNLAVQILLFYEKNILSFGFGSNHFDSNMYNFTNF